MLLWALRPEEKRRREKREVKGIQYMPTSMDPIFI